MMKYDLGEADSENAQRRAIGLQGRALFAEIGASRATCS